MGNLPVTVTVNYLFIFSFFFNELPVVRRIEVRNATYKHLFIIIIIIIGKSN